MELNLKFNITDFEAISENSENKIVGGFSKSFSNQKEIAFSAVLDNNCNGGNCVSGCGGNSGCNTVAGCGKQIE